MTDPLTDSDFLRVFVERVQKVVGWPTWETLTRTVYARIWHHWAPDRWCYVVNNGSDSRMYDPHEAAELVRGWMRGWLRKHCCGLAIDYFPGTETWRVAVSPGAFRVDECLGKGPNENSALVAAFDKTQEQGDPT